MQGVNVFENRAGFLIRCLSLYTSGTGFLILYLLALLLILYAGSRRERTLFIPQAVILLITVYNPLFPILLDRIFDVNSEYYRFFWITPVVILVPYAAVKLISGAGSHRAVTVVLVAAMFAAGANPVFAGGLKISENIYKVPDELIQICEMIHEDSGSEYARVFFEYEYNMEARQYDPRILLCVDREDYLYAVNYSYTEEMLSDDEKPVNRILALLVRNVSMDSEVFCDALEKTGTQYVVLTKGHPQEAYVKSAGLYEAGSTKSHTIYRYDLMDAAQYEPVDYSGAEHRFSYRRLK